MGGGKGGTTNVSQRPLTDQELDLLSTQKDALKQSIGIAQQQQDLANKNQGLWESNYLPFETNDLKNAMVNANAKMGTVDQNAYTLNKANLFNGLSSSYSQAQDNLDAELAKRGLSNSGAAVQGMKDLYTNKANAMAQANNQAYTQGVNTGDTYRQQELANLTGYANLGRGMSGMAQNYLGQSAGTYGQAAQIAGSTANGIGQNNTSYMGNAMQAKSSAKGGMGQLLGTGIGAYAALA